MTEGQSIIDEDRMCIRICFEVGHTCTPRQSLGRAALDWKIWVRGASGQDISPLIQKVVFFLSPSTAFVYPKRVVQEPPYEIQESGSASMDVPIHLYLNFNNPDMIKLKYSFRVTSDMKPETKASYICYDFPNPSRELHKCLMNCGGELIARCSLSSNPRDGNLFIIQEKERSKTKDHTSKVDKPTKEKDRQKEKEKDSKTKTEMERSKIGTNSSTEGSKIVQISQILNSPKTTKRIHEGPSTSKNSKSKYSPKQKHSPKIHETPKAKKDDKKKKHKVKLCNAKVKLEKLFKNVSMTDFELGYVANLCCSLDAYEKAPHAITLPPLSDPIYRVPDLPLPLRLYVKDVDNTDYALM